MKKYRVNLIDGIKPQEKGGTVFQPVQGKARYFWQPARKKRLPILIQIGIFILVIIVVYTNRVFLTQESILTHLGRLSFWQGVAQLVLHPERVLKGELTDRINFLILGMGGAEHEGPYLTDTIILASLKPSQKKAALISVPRDLYVPSKDFGWQKINALNALGETKKRDGIKAIKNVVEDIFEMPIHYYIRLNFNGLVELVNFLGGLEIKIERSFVDNAYPALDFKYQTISFEKGVQVLSGERILQFVRSRHGTNNENSDFARMKRQQKVIIAIKDKLEKQGFFSQPNRLLGLANIYAKNIETNLNLAEIVKLGKLVKEIPQENIFYHTFEAGPENVLYAEILDNGAYVLKPKEGDFKKLAKVVKNIFYQKTEGKSVLSKVIILNGTYISGLAKNQAEILSSDFEIVEISNAPSRDIEKTIIYDLTPGGKEKELEILKSKLKAEIKKEPPPYPQNKKADFIIILGKNS